MSYYHLWLLFILWIGEIRACDICGSNPNSFYVGLLPNYTQNFVGIKQQYSYFHTFHEDSKAIETDYINEFSLQGRWSVNKKFQTYISIPYLLNRSSIDGQLGIVHGIGDISILGLYTLIDNSDSLNTGLYHQFQLGGGIKIPTGKSDAIANGNTILPMLQVGTGSWDFLSQAFYTLRWKRWGTTLEGSYRFNTEGTQSYKIGNALALNLRIFHWIQMPKIALIPTVGFVGEVLEENRRKNIYDPMSGGLAIRSLFGASIFWKNLSFSSNFILPLYQNINSGYTNNSFRISNQIIYFIKSKNRKSL